MNIGAIKNTTTMNDDQLQAWRKQGIRQRKTMLIVTLSAFTLGILAMVLLSIRTAFPAPLPQSSAQPGQQRGMRWGRRGNELSRLSKELNLTDEQKAKVKPILQNEHKQMAALRNDASLSRQEKRAKFMDIRSKTLDQIHPILTEEQQAKLQQIQQKREQRMKEWHGRHSGSQTPE